MKASAINIFFLIALLCSSLSSAESISVTCGASNGYSYYFEGGAVNAESSGFTGDGITDGKITLILDDEGGGDILAVDATQQIKSLSSEGGEVLILSGDSHVNWLGLYPDGTITLDSLHLDSMRLASYRNTTGNKVIAKASLMASDCAVN